MSENPTGGGSSSVVPGQEQVPRAEDSTLSVNQRDPSSDTDKKKVPYIFRTVVVAAQLEQRNTFTYLKSYIKVTFFHKSTVSPPTISALFATQFHGFVCLFVCLLLLFTVPGSELETSKSGRVKVLTIAGIYMIIYIVIFMCVSTSCLELML